MLLREELEKREYDILSEKAVKSADSRGRRDPEEPCEMRTEFQRDRDRIIHSKAFPLHTFAIHPQVLRCIHCL